MSRCGLTSTDLRVFTEDDPVDRHTEDAAHCAEHICAGELISPLPPRDLFWAPPDCDGEIHLRATRLLSRVLDARANCFSVKVHG